MIDSGRPCVDRIPTAPDPDDLPGGPSCRRSLVLIDLDDAYPARPTASGRVLRNGLSCISRRGGGLTLARDLCSRANWWRHSVGLTQVGSGRNVTDSAPGPSDATYRRETRHTKAHLATMFTAIARPASATAVTGNHVPLCDVIAGATHRRSRARADAEYVPTAGRSPGRRQPQSGSGCAPR